MADTQAFSVDWTVEIAPEGDVSEDVSEITIIEEADVDTATITLDTSKRPHALEEQRDIHIEITDGNITKQFDGVTDSISDDDTRPIVTVDARSAIGVMDDSTAVGVIDEDNLFRVIDAILDTSAGQVRELSFNPSELEEQYGTFASSTNFGAMDVNYVAEEQFFDEDYFQMETSDQGKEAELRWEYYQNNTGTTYQMDITGQDSDGNTVTATVDLPPGESPQEAFGSDKIKLALSDGNEQWVQADSISTNMPTFDEGSGKYVTFSGYLWNHVKTDWRFRLNSLTSVRQAVNSIVSYISGLDQARDWEFIVDDVAAELIVQPEQDTDPSTYLFKEGNNVLKPVANRDLDGVRNFIKVVGAGDVNVWLWAYDGSLQWSLNNPFENGDYPDQGSTYAQSSGGGQNDIDQINIRGEKLSSNRITSSEQAINIGKKALKEFYRTPVTGQAPISGLHKATVGDKAEVYYPSRGIPQKVTDNVYNIEKVETRITPEKAKTLIDFGTSEPNLADHIASGSMMIRNDISNNVAQYSQSVTTSKQIWNDGGGDGGGSSGEFPVVGRLLSQNDDGTWQVETEDGTTIDNVRVI